MHLEKGKAEKILISAIDEWLKETDIKGTKIVEENLQRLNKANILALSIFEDIEKVEFETPNSGMSFTSTYIYCQGISIENVKNNNKEKFDELMKTVDEFSVNPIDGKTLGISFSIDNIWVE